MAANRLPPRVSAACVALVLINRDYPPEPYLLAVGRTDGKLAWKVGLEPGSGTEDVSCHALH